MNGSDNSFGSVIKGYVLALSVARVGALFAVVMLLRPTLLAKGTEILIGIIALLAPPLFVALHITRGQVTAAHVCYLAFVACSSLQLGAGFVEIATYLSFEVNVVVYGAVTLVASLVKMTFISLGPSFILSSSVWLGYGAQVCIVAVAYRCPLFTTAASLVLLPPAPVVLEDVGNPMFPIPHERREVSVCWDVSVCSPQTHFELDACLP